MKSNLRAPPPSHHGRGSPDVQHGQGSVFLAKACCLGELRIFRWYDRRSASDNFVFGASYMRAVGFVGFTPEAIGLIAAAFMLVFTILGSVLADVINRRRILLIAAAVFLVSAIPYFYLINKGSVLLATIAEIAGFGFVLSSAMARSRPFYTKQFSDSLSRLRRESWSSNFAGLW